MLTCRFRLLASLCLAPLALSVAHADVTVRYRMEFKMNPALPAPVAGVLNGSALPQETVLRLKGGKGFSTSMGFDSIVDFATQEMIFLDQAGKRYAKMTSDQLGEEMARAMPPLPSAGSTLMASMKASVSPARVTGRTAVIQGVEAAEREIVISVEGPSMPNMPPGPTLRMVMQLWSAQPGETLRVPAIRELTGYSIWSYTTMNPSASMGKMMKQMPGFSDAFEPMVKEMQKGAPVLRMHMEMFMPGLAAMLQRMPAGNTAFPAGFDPNAPFMQMNQEMVELSSAPVPDSFFQIPEGYQAVAASEVIQALFVKSQTAAGKQP